MMPVAYVITETKIKVRNMIFRCSGILKADEGTAYVNRYDIHDYLTDVRRSTGICPQKDMLFHDLSVMEHLLLFAWASEKHRSKNIHNEHSYSYCEFNWIAQRENME
jgi:ABC-type multidrug transport system ATPase subunit